MRRLLLSFSLLALGTGAITSVGTLPAQAQGYDWTGAYGGLSASYGRADYTYAPDPGSWPDGSGWGIGGLVGYNWQQLDQVYGVEGHVSVNRIRGSGIGAMGAVRTDMRSLASLRGRAGLARNRTLFFVTAGAALANVRHTAVDLGVSDSQTVGGVVIGIGVEHALAGGWHLRGDLEHYRFRDSDFDTGNPGAFPDVGIRANVLRLSAIFRF